MKGLINAFFLKNKANVFFVFKGKKIHEKKNVEIWEFFIEWNIKKAIIVESYCAKFNECIIYWQEMLLYIGFEILMNNSIE